MRLVFENIDFTIVDHMRTILEAAGIRTELRSAGASGRSGVVPYTQVYPELWIHNNRDENRGCSIIRDYREKEAVFPVSPEWRCAKCGETVDGIFTECWNCGTPSPAIER